MADVPRFGKTALELLDRNNNPEIDSLMSKYGFRASSAIIGFLCPVGQNYYNKRPLLSGIQRHFGYAIAAIGISHLVEMYQTSYYAERDAVLRHYVQLHPEDFELPERKKFRDHLTEWIPIR